MSDPDDRDLKTEELQMMFANPLMLTEEQWTTIKKIARNIMDDLGIEYSKALVLAYIEWFEMAEMELTRH